MPGKRNRKVNPLYPPGTWIPAKVPRFRRFRFLNLAPEIRNRIYDFLLGDYRVLVRGHPAEIEEPMWCDSRDPRRRKPRYHLCCWFEVGVVDDLEVLRCAHSFVPIEMLLVNRTIHDEIIPVLYSRMTFCFEVMKPLNCFLAHASSRGIANIRKIEIVHAQYGEPLWLDDREFKKRHDAKWLKLCRRIGKEMVSLQQLRLDFRICDWPTRLAMNAGWVKPLLEMKGMGLDRVDVVLRCGGIEEDRLENFAKKLELEMMNDEGKRNRKIEDRKRQAQELEKYRIKKAAESNKPKEPPMKILSIIIAPDSAESSPKKPAPAITRNAKSLEKQGFTRLPVASPTQWDNYTVLS